MIRLVKPSLAYLPGYVAALRAGWSPDSTRDTSQEELARLEAAADHHLRVLRGETGGMIRTRDGREVERLPGEVRWIWDGAFCGTINVRHLPGTTDLPPHVSGHIGYSVIPAKQRRGYGREALRRMLGIARRRGLPRVLLTCDADNTASRSIIEANGGVPGPPGDDGKLHFWITLTEESAMDLPEIIEESIAAWNGVQPPNDPGRRMAADLASTIAAFEALRGTLAFEDEPSSFEAALQATKERA